MIIDGVVLAGGQSSRMGRDKALLPWGEDTTLLDNAVAILEPMVRKLHLSGRHYGDYSPILDVDPEQGPLGAFYSIYRTLQADPSWDALAVLPCDMPLVQSGWFLEMAKILESQLHVDAVFTAREGRFFPLTAVYRRRGLEMMARSYTQGNRKVLRALQDINNEVILKNEEQLENVNRPQDYQRLLEMRELSSDA
ncbi:molybdenum cofactor guanylyltransferase [Desulfurispira natronophila]|uniref:Probable molybdenum cofactor guanylyltransferase n=1 Tax=Desulfurispira natronophila TaxID=682562 RepID=A0A7W7Y324_9BACT|nr:molybdenum cofactor guanylyltransferase [Desulfurispira natronophila]MBB5021186.1 molybdopterin-guanine dinucleotide biosynthesis protein A [Desulfurispira natronophila]